MIDVKDALVRLYVKRYIMPRALIFDKPGFVDFKISGKTPVFARQVIIPERFFVNLETAMLSEYGKKGEEILYKTGKRFGYSFAQLGRFENIKDHPGEAVKDWVVIASKFVEGTYASKITQRIDVRKKVVDYTLRNFVICRKIGYDLFFASGGAAGLIAWILQEPDIESKLYNSRYERNEHVCNVRCAPYDILKETFTEKLHREKNLEGLEQDPTTYRSFNEEVDIKYTKSFQTYLNAGLFTYHNGMISYKGKDERFFLMEVTAAYLLDLAMKGKKMRSILFNSAFSAGKEVFGNYDVQSLAELLSALGWGEVVPVSTKRGIKIIISRFPWTKYYKEVDYTIIRGILSGALTKIRRRETILEKPKISVSEGHLALLFQ